MDAKRLGGIESDMADDRWKSLDVWKMADESARFVNISLGSMAETKYLLYFAHHLRLLPDERYEQIENGYERLGKRLWRFYEAVRRKKDARGTSPSIIASKRPSIPAQTD